MRWLAELRTFARPERPEDPSPRVGLPAHAAAGPDLGEAVRRLESLLAGGARGACDA